MKKTKILSLLLCLSLFCALIVPCTKAYAKSDPDNGMKISKTATANKDGSYTITLEAYATGAKVISEITKDVPTDIILVLDQSGSMADDIGTVSFSAYTGKNARNVNLYTHRHNGGDNNLWHKLDDGSYVSVSVTKTTKYNELSASLPNYSYRSDCYYDYVNNLYEKVGDEYKKVTLTYAYSYAERDYVFTYTFSDGSSITSVGTDTSPDLGNHSPLYTPVADGNDTVYTYTYTDGNGVEQTIDTSTGQNTSFTTLYSRTTSTAGGGSRLNALKSAANAFANAVAVKAAGEDGDINTTADNIDHRIAVVGYADTDWDYDYNTGVFIGNTLNRYEDAAAEVYSTALQDMSTTNGKNNVTASLNALQASGATRTDYGLIMAKGILDANPVPAGETRNRVVIVFTDGSPTSSNGFERDVANSAISTANAIKAGETTVYSIGIFSGADASTAGKEPDEDYYDGFLRPNYTDAEMSAACNWFMQKVSSNNGTPRTPSYYLSAGDEASLNNIFQQISSNIETGGSSTTLDENAVIKDIISPQFQLPEGTTANDITLETYSYTGENKWEKNSGVMGATATVNSGQVNVTGFNFKENWCGTETANGTTTYRGNKLVISFPVVVKDGFLGGNDVYTNTKAGVYENDTAQKPVFTFERPQVDVAIKDITVTPEDKNVYLLSNLTAEQIKSGATVKVGNVDLNLAAENYGLASWQNEYVDIAVTYTDKKGNTLTNLNDLTDDTTYTVSVNVSPKYSGTVTGQTGKGEGKINVFKPELTFQDSTAYYGDTAPDCTGNLTQTKWKHGETLSDAEGVTMIGTAPTLDPTYTPEAGKIADGKINTKEDISVDVSVKIGTDDVTTYTTFQHTDCTGKTCTLPAGAEFFLHVKTCTLTVQKTGGDSNEPYVFNIYKDNVKYSEVTVKGNGSENIEELPVGTYTIEEDTGWSWRFNPSYSESVILSKDNTSGTITCTNEKNKNQWLNGFSDVVKNISGVSNNN